MHVILTGARVQRHVVQVQVRLVEAVLQLRLGSLHAAQEVGLEHIALDGLQDVESLCTAHIKQV